MSRIWIVVSLLLVPSLAFAQPDGPPGDQPPVPAEPVPPPAEPPPAPPAEPAPAQAPPAPVAQPTPHELCIQRRHELEAAANGTADLSERTRLLQSLPDCSKSDVVLPPAPPTCGFGQELVAGECMGGPEMRGSTTEFSVGVAWLSGGLGSSSTIVHGVGGLNFGVGKFVNHDLALSLRMSGITWLDGGVLYLGMIGANLQAWFGDGWIGGGIGVGVLAGCADTCDASTTSGFDLRAGYRVGGHTNVSLELMSIGGFFSDTSLQTVSVLLGYQSF